MPVVQPVLGTVTNTYICVYIIYDHSGEIDQIDNYEEYKRVINQITGRLYIYILETIICLIFKINFLVCVVIYSNLLLIHL